MKNAFFLILFAFISMFCEYAHAQKTYYVVSIHEEIFINNKPLKAKSKIPAGAVLKFSSAAARAVVISPTEGKFIISANKLIENKKGEFISPLANVIVPAIDYYFADTRAESAGMSAEDFGASLYDNPAESEVITIYFIEQNAIFSLPVPSNLLRREAHFFLKNKTHTIDIPVKAGKLIFNRNMQDTNGKNINLIQLKQAFDFVYNNLNTKYTVGKVQFEIF
jgi:hypothetical protein